jgi:hypothetical protein
MKLRRKTVFSLLGAATAAILAVGLIAPRLDANRFGARVEESLREALGRQVKIGTVRLELFAGPGFSVDNVVVYEDPAAGAEPCAYIDELEAAVSFKSFWTGRLEFSSLRLNGAHINLARPPGGRWNFETLLRRIEKPGGPARSVRLPEIQVRDGRINFRLGERKSIFYLAVDRLDATPPSSTGGEWRVRFDGEPARTDRSAQGFGKFTVRARWRPGHGAPSRLEATVDIEKSSLSDIARLAHGHDIGVHGQMSSHARLAGPLSDIQITGRMQIGDIHRWDLLPPHGEGWPLDYRGKIDLPAQALELETVPPPGGTLPVSLQFRAAGYLSETRWAALVKLDHMPSAPLPEVARHMGLALPESLAVSGDLTGVIGYSPESGPQGTVSSEKASLTIPNAPPLRLENAQVRVDGNTVHLDPAALEAGGQRAAIEGDYAWTTQTWSARLTAAGMDIAGGESAARHLLGTIPVLDQCTKGIWRGQLDYLKDGDRPGRWSGALRIEGATLPVTGFADPLEVSSARVTVRDDGVVVDRIAGRLGAIELKGEYRHGADAAQPHVLQLSIPKLEAQELERLLRPALRRDENLLSRALRFGRTRIPEWLDARRAEAVVDIGTLVVKDMPLEKVRAHVRWDGSSLEATDLTARYGEGSITGRLSANLRRSAPAYRANMRFRGLSWMGGIWSGRSVLQTSGTGPELLRNLHLEGSFKGSSVPLAAEAEAKNLSGSYALTMPRGLPVFRFSDLVMTLGEASFKGRGATGADGRVYFDLSDGQTQMRMNATLSPFQVEFPATRNPGNL